MEKKQIKITLFQAIMIVLIIIILLVGISLYLIKVNKDDGEIIRNPITGKIDDWKYDYKSSSEGIGGINVGGIGISNGGIFSSADSFSASGQAVGGISASPNIGFSTGGAKDINNFRENIEEGYFPISTDITYNGLFYDYVFDTGNKNESDDLFSPSYSCAISNDPISDKQEYYMTVGLNSNIKESDFQRKKLNLVVVLDISGSMSSGFSSYYYDNFLGNEETKEKENKTKMQIANESVNILLDQLKEDDRFGVVLFDNSSYIGKPISLVSETDMEAIKGHILEIQPQGGTNFEAGYKEATELFEEYVNKDANEYENRIIVITDAMPNYGTTSKDGLLSYVERNSNNGIYTTFIGVGVDFNSELIEKITDVKGANYYSVHNSKEFKERMGEQFEYMVTPLVFDLNLDLNSEDYKIEMVYGSDTTNKENGNIMKVNTLFPSKTTDTGEVKGGVVLLKLSKIADNQSGQVELNVSYKDREGKKYSNKQVVEFNEKEEFYDNTGIRKAIVLTRYVNTLKNWILYERSEEKEFLIRPAYGICDCVLLEEEIYRILGENERTSVELTVSDEYKEIFTELVKYIKSENEYLKDDTLKKELEILNILINK